MTQEQARSLRRSLSCMRLLRSAGDRDDRGWTLLHVGSPKGYLKESIYIRHPREQQKERTKTTAKVKRLLNEGTDANVAAWGPKSQGVTPLHLAAEGGHLRIMDLLLEHGANIDARTKGSCGWTPLHIAAKERKRPAVKFLVENGAFLPDNINDTRFNPPLHYCVGLEWAYDEMKRIQDDTSSSYHRSHSSEN